MDQLKTFTEEKGGPRGKTLESMQCASFKFKSNIFA